MLTDKDLANLALETIKHSVEDLTKAAMESSGNLRQTFLQLRNQCEQSQERLAQLATAKGWYMPAAQANPQDIQNVAQFYQAGLKEPAIRI